jgi:hypothetical protein
MSKSEGYWGLDLGLKRVGYVKWIDGQIVEAGVKEIENFNDLYVWALQDLERPICHCGSPRSVWTPTHGSPSDGCANRDYLDSCRRNGLHIPTRHKDDIVERLQGQRTRTLETT